MRALVGMAFLFFCFYKGPASADDVTSAVANTEIITNVTVNATAQATPPGNQGYIYGTPPKADDAAPAANGNTHHLLRDIINLIEGLDAWERQNLW